MTKKHVLIDEFWSSPVLQRERIKELIIGVEGTPKVQYQVEGNRVFVFDKLVDMLCSSAIPEDADTRRDYVIKALPDAYVTPEEAIRVWGVLPYPYEVEQYQEGWRIVHSRFSSVIPVLFSNRDDVNRALVTILLGGTIAERNNGIVDVGATGRSFTHKGQTLRELLSVASRLQVEPLSDLEVPVSDLTGLLSCSYTPGCALLDESTFNLITSASRRWQSKTEWISQQLDETILEWLESYPMLPLRNLNTAVSIDMEWEDEELMRLKRLRESYPELPMLSDTCLYSLYDGFHLECYHMNSWEPSREKDFLFYLVGKLCEIEHEGELLSQAGKFVVFALMRNQDVAKAMDLGKQCFKFGGDILNLLFWRWNVTNYIQDEQQRVFGAGQPVGSFANFFKYGRKYSPDREFIITQHIDDFVGSFANCFKY